MWTDTTRAHHARAELALPSDLTDAEWALLEGFFDPPSKVGRPRKWPMRRIVEAILYLLRGGLPWRMLPPGFPPVSTVQRYFYRWRDSGLWETINQHLVMAVRQAQGREPSPSAGVPPRVEYSVTPEGAQLDLALAPLAEWGKEHQKRAEKVGQSARAAPQTAAEGAARG